MNITVASFPNPKQVVNLLDRIRVAYRNWKSQKTVRAVSKVTGLDKVFVQKTFRQAESNGMKITFE